jgi:hypothetical protein
MAFVKRIAQEFTAFLWRMKRTVIISSFPLTRELQNQIKFGAEIPRFLNLCPITSLTFECSTDEHPPLQNKTTLP